MLYTIHFKLDESKAQVPHHHSHDGQLTHQLPYPVGKEIRNSSFDQDYHYDCNMNPVSATTSQYISNHEQNYSTA